MADFSAGCVQLWICSAEPPGEHRYENLNNNSQLTDGLEARYVALGTPIQPQLFMELEDLGAKVNKYSKIGEHKNSFVALGQGHLLT